VLDSLTSNATYTDGDYALTPISYKLVLKQRGGETIDLVDIFSEFPTIVGRGGSGYTPSPYRFICQDLEQIDSPWGPKGPLFTGSTTYVQPNVGASNPYVA
jgi:hypothetical protein